MKKIVFILLCGIILGGTLFAQNIFRRNAAQQREAVQVQQRTGPEVSFERNVHDFGTIAHEIGRAPAHFEFTNTGTTPVIIHRVGVGCVCTAASYSREPILPGQTSSIIVEYIIRHPGAFNRPVTVHTNVSDTVFTLFVRGTVAPRQQ
jgi:hypothetical protein